MAAYIPVGLGLRICVAVFSYDGTLCFSVTGDRETAPDIETLCRGIDRGMSELVSSTEGSAPGGA
jgi:hypothetical protein